MSRGRSARIRKLSQPALLWASLVLFVGCAHEPSNVGTGVDNDPLVGATAQNPTARTKAAMTTATATTGSGRNATPLPLAPNPTASAAALAGGAASANDKDIDPRLAPDPRGPGGLTNTDGPGVSGAGIALQGPTARADITNSRETNAQPVSNSTAPIESLQKGLDLIKSYGAADRCLEEVSDGVWKFSCRMPIQSTADIRTMKVVEATLPGEDGLVAVRAVLQKIEQLGNTPVPVNR